MIFELRNFDKKVPYDASASDEAKWEAVQAVSEPVEGVHSFQVFRDDELIMPVNLKVKEEDDDVRRNLDYHLANALVEENIYE